MATPAAGMASALPSALLRSRTKVRKAARHFQSGVTDTDFDPLESNRPGSTSTILFSGVPQMAGGEAVLLDSSTDAAAKRIPDQVTITRLEIRFPDGSPQSLDPGLCLLIFVDDLAAPRARVKLADLLRQRGQRPLNLRRQVGEAVRLVLMDPAGAWKAQGPRIEVAFGWD